MLPFVAAIVEQFESDPRDVDLAGEMKSTLALASISTGHFALAMASLGPGRPSEQSDQADVFNYAVAEWGHSSTIPSDLFSLVVRMDRSRKDHIGANYEQCMTIALLATGDVDAARGRWEAAAAEVDHIAQGTVRVFSAWRYLEVGAEEFREDLAEMRRRVWKVLSYYRGCSAGSECGLEQVPRLR